MIQWLMSPYVSKTDTILFLLLILNDASMTCPFCFFDNQLYRRVLFSGLVPFPEKYTAGRGQLTDKERVSVRMLAWLFRAKDTP